jgi:uncharacterized protein YegL
MALDGKIQALNTAISEALPFMRQVAHANPNAAVFVRTLRFSTGAQWIETAPVDLGDYRWTDLVADPVPSTAAFAAEFRSRLRREGAKTGDVQVSLIWNNYNDLDLHVICPSDEEIYFAHKKCQCGGELDVDMNISPESEAPVENVYWPHGGAPQGHYQILVDHYTNHQRPGCEDPTAFRVAISVGGVVEEFSGSISHGDAPRLVHEFDLVETMAPGKSGGNTDMGAALRLVAEQLHMPPMSTRALPPVLVLVSDGQPTDDFEEGLKALMAQPWGKKAVRIAIAIGQEAATPDARQVFHKFIGHQELEPLQANSPEALVKQIRWASTAVLQAASSPASQAKDAALLATNVPIPVPTAIADGPSSATDVW